MHTGLNIIKHDFDSMENHSPYSQKTVAQFIDDEKETAFIKAERWLRDKDCDLYLGYNLKIYPWYEVERTTIN